MADVEELGIAITMTGEVEADRALSGIAQKGDAAEKATLRLTAAQQQQSSMAERSAIQAARAAEGMSREASAAERLAREQAALIARSQALAQAAETVNVKSAQASTRLVTEAASVRSLAQQMGGLAEAERNAATAMDRLNERTRAHTAAMNAAAAAQRAAAASASTAATSTAALGAATGVTSAGINSVRAAMTSMAAAALGAAPGVGQLTSVIGTMALGSGVMVGVLAGVAALSFAWDKLTESARKAKEQHQEAIRVLEELVKKNRQGPAGEVGASVSAAQADVRRDDATIARLEQQIANLRGSRNQGAVAGTLQSLQDELAATQRHRQEALAEALQGQQEATRLRREAREGEQRDQASALAQRLAFNQKDAEARRQALSVLARDREEYARLIKLPDTPERSGRIGALAQEIKQLDEALNPKAKKTPRTQDMRDMDAITAALREQEEQAQRTAQARTQAGADAGAATQQQLTEAELLLAAIRESEGAYKAQQREIAILNQLTAEGVTLADADYAARKRVAEQLYDTKAVLDATADAQRRAQQEADRATEQAQREQERRARDVHRSISNAIEGALTDIANRRNPFVAIGEAIKRAAIHALAEALTTKIQGKVGDLLGIAMPASKQEKAAAQMDAAAEKQLAAARAFLEAAGFDSSGLAPKTPSTMPKDGSVAIPQYVQQFLKIGGAAYGGYQTGYGIGAATRSQTAGAIGGAASGAAAGAAIGGLPGAFAGGLMGLVGGLVGAKEAARAAAEALKNMQIAARDAAADFHSRAIGDDLQAELRQIGREFSATMTQIAAAFPGTKPPYGVATTLPKAPTGEELMKQAIDDYLLLVARTRELFAIATRRATEDWQQRLDAATPGNERAEAIAANSRRLDRELEDLRVSFGSEIDAREEATYAIARQAIEAEKLAFATGKATDAMNTFVRNAPTGFKLEGYVQDYARGATYPGQMQLPVNPFVPPMSPLTPTMPALSRTGTVATNATPVTWTGDIIVQGSDKSPREIAKAVVEEFDRKAAALGGLNSTRTDGMEAYS